MRTFKVRNGMVLVKPEKKEQEGKIAVIGIAGKRQAGEDLEVKYKNVGVVVSRGAGPAPFTAGDKVVFPEYAGQEIDGPAGKFLLMGFDSVLGLVE